MQARPGSAVPAGRHWIDSSFLDALYGGGRLSAAERSAILDGADPAGLLLSDYDLYWLTLGRLGRRDALTSADLYRARARGALVSGQAVWPDTVLDDCVLPVDGSEESIAAFVGFASTSAPDGAAVGVYIGGRVPLFGGLVRATEYFLYGADQLAPWSQIPDGAWTRSIGPALSRSALLLRPGEVLRKGSMPYKLNPSGHMVPDTIVAQTKTYTAGALIAPNTAVYIKQADGKAYPLDGTEAAANAYAGITAAGAANAAIVTVYPAGTNFSTTGASFVDGEVYAKEDGTLVAYGAVGSAKYTLCVLEADGTNTGSVIKGEVKLTPRAQKSREFMMRFATRILLSCLPGFFIAGSLAAAVAPYGENSSGHSVPADTSVPLSGFPSGAAVYAYTGQPVATATTGLGTITANAASNNFTGLSSPDICRQIQATAGVGWDGGNLTLNGADCSGLAQSATYGLVGGATTHTTKPFSTITSATKSAVGASTATVTLGPDDGLGISTRRRQVKRCFVLYWNGSAYAIDGNPTLQSPAATDPYIIPTNPPTGGRLYQIVCGLL